MGEEEKEEEEECVGYGSGYYCLMLIINQ